MFFCGSLLLKSNLYIFKNVRTLIFFITCLKIFPVAGQVSQSFEFLHTPNNARMAALGGVNVSLADRDLNFFLSNPALQGDTLSGWASAGYQFYLADIGMATFVYAHDFNTIGQLAFGVQHLNYGTITGYDPAGTETGEFKSSETALVVGKSHEVSNFRIGLNLRFVSSAIAGYRASALMADLGGVFIHPKQELVIGLTVKNLGVVLSQYSDTRDAELPFDVQAGVSFKPEHMPLRFSVTAYNIARPEIVYSDAGSQNEEPGTLDKVLRRFNFAAEILLHRNVNVLLGYNYLIHQELKLDEGGGGAGISAGIAGRIKSVEFVFSRSSYVAGNAGYAFTILADIENMLKRR
jgi:hypothetical protein